MPGERERAIFVTSVRCSLCQERESHICNKCEVLFMPGEREPYL